MKPTDWPVPHQWRLWTYHDWLKPGEFVRSKYPRLKSWWRRTILRKPPIFWMDNRYRRSHVKETQA